MMSVTTTITMDKKNIEKFIKLYGEGNGDFSLSLVIPEQSPTKKTVTAKKKSAAKKNSGPADCSEWRIKNWGTRTDVMDYDDGLALHDILSGDLNFQTADTPPIKVFEKMAADGLDFEIYWEAEDVADWGIGRGKVKDGKFWYCIDFDETAERYQEETGDEWDPRDCAFVNHIDEYGNKCEIDTSRVLVNERNLYFIPVKAMLELGEKAGDSLLTNAFKVPTYMRCIYEWNDIEMDEFSDNLRLETESGEVYLLNKNGKKIKALKDFDHSEKDEYDNVYYPVPSSDLDENTGFETLTKEAEEKWRKFLKLSKSSTKKSQKETGKKAQKKVVATSLKQLKTLVKKQIKAEGPNCDLNFIDVSQITDMSRLFTDSEFNGDISQWDVSNVTTMNSMFCRSKFNGDISQWNVSKVTDMITMFTETPFNGDISKWDVSNVTSMNGMFCGSQFNGDISQWNVSKVTSMMMMFDSSQFKGDISKWDVSKGTNMIGMFDDSALEKTKKLPKWYKK
ncbi:BspA family leucine-rich repeat surface protein [Fibrobacter sp.]|uniref:BspA family leucine-rich repeat surface protein n=1 Tax=Fibrobacter sp. TaxID=35828 RepID=UPI00386EFE8C